MSSTEFNSAHDQRAKSSTSITWKQQISTNLNKCRNLVRDQGVGGSNPLSPTNLFKYLHSKNKAQRPRTCFLPRGSTVETRINIDLFRAARVRRHPQNRLQPSPSRSRPSEKFAPKFNQRKRLYRCRSGETSSKPTSGP